MRGGLARHRAIILLLPERNRAADRENHPPVSELGRRRSLSAVAAGRTLSPHETQTISWFDGCRAGRGRDACAERTPSHSLDAAAIPCDAALRRSGLRADCLCRARVGQAALFLHGAPLNGFQWRGAIERLSAHRRCIAPDFMGLGYSEIPRAAIARGRCAGRDARGVSRCARDPHGRYRRQRQRRRGRAAVCGPSSAACAHVAADELRRRARQSAAQGQAGHRDGARRHAR